MHTVFAAFFALIKEFVGTFDECFTGVINSSGSSTCRYRDRNGLAVVIEKRLFGKHSESVGDTLENGNIYIADYGNELLAAQRPKKSNGRAFEENVRLSIERTSSPILWP